MDVTDRPAGTTDRRVPAPERARDRLRRLLLRLRYLTPAIVLLKPKRPHGRLPDRASSAAVLEELARLPISTWRYQWDPADVRHLGPMAQDFAAAFGLGPDERVIDGTDAAGVNMAATQALYRRVRALEQRVVEMEAKLAERGADADP
jgi:hypothetical protein